MISDRQKDLVIAGVKERWPHVAGMCDPPFDRKSFAEYESIEETARKIGQYTWSPGSTFVWQNLVYVNIAFSADGAQEYEALHVDGDTVTKFESITFGWCSEYRVLQYLCEYEGKTVEQLTAYMRQPVETKHIGDWT